MTDHKDYSLKQVENFLYDAMSNDATAQEIYDVIKGVVSDNYYTYKHQTSKAYELLALLNGNGAGHVGFDIGHDHVFDHIVGENSFLKQDRNSNFPKENTISDKDDPSPECEKSWNDFWEETYYPEEHQKYTDEEIDAMTAAKEKELIGKGYVKVNGFWQKPKTWTVKIEMDGLTGDAYIPVPDDLSDIVGWNVDDELEWIDNKDGSYLLKKLGKTNGNV